MRNSKLSLLVFLVLGGLMWHLRYNNGLAQSNLDQFKMIGPYIVLVLHISLILMAFKDSMFQGILSLLVPVYSFYWLFLVSDAFLVRAIVAGLFVGIGQDSLAFYQVWLDKTIEVVTGWIASGGGDI